MPAFVLRIAGELAAHGHHDAASRQYTRVLDWYDATITQPRVAFSEGLSHGIHLHTDHWLRPLRSTPDFADLMRPKR